MIKFVLQETDRTFADRAGRELAALPRRPGADSLEAFRAEVLEALRRPSTLPRIRQALWKTYTHAKKRGELADADLHDVTVRSPAFLAGASDVARQLTLLERVSFENDLLFGTTPVLARDARRVRHRDAQVEGEGG